MTLSSIWKSEKTPLLLICQTQTFLKANYNHRRNQFTLESIRPLRMVSLVSAYVLYFEKNVFEILVIQTVYLFGIEEKTIQPAIVTNCQLIDG